MSGLLESTLGVVGQVGDSIDKVTGGRAVRGLLAGKPRELASVVPYSDTMGLTNEHDKTSGRDLTDAYGLTSKGSNSFGSHAAGFLADNVLSPANMLGGVAAFKAAPTLAKGLTRGAKALSGLDIADHVAGGAKKLGKFMAGDGGAVKIGGADSLLNHLPWAGRSDITDTTRNAANWTGPGYAGGRDKMTGFLDSGDHTGNHEYYGPLKKGLLGHPELAKIAGEFPEDTKFLGHGAEAIAGISGDGHVIRAAPAQSWLGSSGRADIPQIVQPFRSLRVPGNAKLGSKPWVIEHLPKVNPVSFGRDTQNQIADLVSAFNRDGNTEGFAQGRRALAAYGMLHNDAANVGYDLSSTVKAAHPKLDPWDFNAHNISLTNEGNAIGHDGGMARNWDTSDLISRYSPTAATDSAKAKAARMGGQDAVREAMANGLARGTKGQGISQDGGIMDLNDVFNRHSAVKDFLGKYGHMLNPSASHIPGIDGFQSAATGLPAGFANAPVAPTSSAFAAAPVSSLASAVAKFMGGESGSLNLNAFAGRRNGGGILAALDKANPTGDLPWERAVRIGKEAGVHTSLVPPEEATRIMSKGGLVGPAGKTPLAWYAGKPNTIGLNGHQAAWTDGELMGRLLGEKGPNGSKWFASDRPDAIINHELGHAMHRQGLGLDEYSNSPKLENFSDEGHSNFLQKNLSRYSSTDPYEAVAETVAALKGNHQFSPPVQQGLSKLLYNYGGGNLWQMLGDQKLLKPLGYSLLGTLGVGGALSNEQGA